MRKKLEDSKLIGRKHEFASFLHSEGCVQTIRDFWWAEWHWIRFVVGRVALDQIFLQITYIVDFVCYCALNVKN